MAGVSNSGRMSVGDLADGLLAAIPGLNPYRHYLFQHWSFS